MRARAIPATTSSAAALRLFQIIGLLCLWTLWDSSIPTASVQRVCADVPSAVRQRYTDLTTYEMKTSEVAVGVIVRRCSRAKEMTGVNGQKRCPRRAADEVLMCYGHPSRPNDQQPSTVGLQTTMPLALAEVGEPVEATVTRLLRRITPQTHQLPIISLATPPLVLAVTPANATQHYARPGVATLALIGLYSQPQWFVAEGRDASLLMYLLMGSEEIAAAWSSTSGAERLLDNGAPTLDSGSFTTPFNYCKFVAMDAALSSDAATSSALQAVQRLELASEL